MIITVLGPYKCSVKFNYCYYCHHYYNVWAPHPEGNKSDKDSPTCDLYSLTWWKPFPFNIPQWLHEVRKVKNKPSSFSRQGGQKLQRIKNNISSNPWQSGIGWRASSPSRSSGKDIIQVVQPRSVCHVASFLLPQVVKISDLKGLVLGQEFSIGWKLPVSDLEKFNCYPEDPAVSEENCRQRGCLWEVMIGRTLPQWTGSVPWVIRHLETLPRCWRVEE